MFTEEGMNLFFQHLILLNDLSFYHQAIVVSNDCSKSKLSAVKYQKMLIKVQGLKSNEYFKEFIMQKWAETYLMQLMN